MVKADTNAKPPKEPGKAKGSTPETAATQEAEPLTTTLGEVQTPTPGGEQSRPSDFQSPTSESASRRPDISVEEIQRRARGASARLDAEVWVEVIVDNLGPALLKKGHITNDPQIVALLDTARGKRLVRLAKSD